MVASIEIVPRGDDEEEQNEEIDNIAVEEEIENEPKINFIQEDLEESEEEIESEESEEDI
jgi:hypothetical protein